MAQVRWYNCGLKLMALSGKPAAVSSSLLHLYHHHSVSRTPLFMEYLLAVIYTESRFNRNAKSVQDAYGLMQITQVAADEAASRCQLKSVTSMASLHDSATNIRYGSCYLSYLLEEMDGDLDRTLIVYNGGYRQLQRYDRGESIVAETANYVLLVNRTLKMCRGGS